jgi:hypothetical protein
LADRRRPAIEVIGAGHVWPIASAWVGGIAAGLKKNSPPMHHMIDRRVRVFSARLSPQSTAVQGGRLDFSRNSMHTGFELVKVPVLQGIMKLLTTGSCDVVVGLLT